MRKPERRWLVRAVCLSSVGGMEAENQENDGGRGLWIASVGIVGIEDMRLIIMKVGHAHMRSSSSCNINDRQLLVLTL